MIENGSMAAAGLAKINIAKKNGSWTKAIEALIAYDMPAELAKALGENELASRFFESLSGSCRKQYINWIAGVKKEETRSRRAKQAVDMLNKNKNPGEA